MYDPTEDPFKDDQAPISNDDWSMFLTVIAVLVLFGLLLAFAS